VARVVGRLAPTPSGRLHLGNVCAFAAAWLSTRSSGGRLLLRIEDVDRRRARPALARGIKEDLRWLGLHWDDEVPPQSAREYQPALDRLRPRLYRCMCTRGEILSDGRPYPGTCRDRALADGALRVRLPAGRERVDDRRRGTHLVDFDEVGDPVLQRRDGCYAYNLAVVVDDLEDGVTEVVRGADLLDQTAVQAHLWQALGGNPPTWLHTPVILGPNLKKLSKSHQSSSVAELRKAGWSPQRIWAVVLPWLGLASASDLAEAVGAFSPDRIQLGPIVWQPPPVI
jgi:glutamyl/glutaminyl-tRNA synthetase